MQTRLLSSLLTCLIFLGCHQPETAIKPSAEINQIVGAQTKLSEPAPEGTVLLSDEPSYPQIINGSGYTTRKRTFRLTKRFSTHLNETGFDQADPNNGQGLYVGSIVRLKSFGQQGNLTSIGITAREQVTLTSSLPGSTPKAIQPGKAAYQTVMNQWLQQPANVVASISYDAAVMNTTEQALMSQGVNVGWGPVTFANQFSTSTDLQQQDIVVAFKQIYHTVTMDYPGSAANYFTTSIDLTALRTATDPDDPLGYVSEITYGRLLFAKLHFKTSINTDKQQLLVSILSGIQQGLSLSTELKKTLAESSVQLTVLGGDAASATNVLVKTNGLTALESISKWIKDGANSPDKGAPISYQVRYLSDNSLVTLGASTDYNDFTNAQLVKPSQFSINQLTVTKLPSLDPSGKYWDGGLVGLPDVFFTITDTKGTNLYALDPSKRKENVGEEELKQGFITWNLSSDNVTYSVNAPIKLLLWDYDSIGSNEFIGEVTFNPNGLFPQNQMELISIDGKSKIVIILDWH
ncbi:thiol-activated cytolysin family protein [uncultured Fibrella sp.]|uniref:thiol-activated cytolysin family protein n=1 Tax=uncultured Fibrella sp. TaxID=1284596 RepID=UPI0035CBF75E